MVAQRRGNNYKRMPASRTAPPPPQPTAEVVVPLPEGTPESIGDAWLVMCSAAADEQAAGAEEAEIDRSFARAASEAQRLANWKKAWDLHVQNRLGFAEIGERLGISSGTAWQWVKNYTRVEVPIAERETARRLLIAETAMLTRIVKTDLAAASGKDRLPFVKTLRELNHDWAEFHGLDEEETTLNVADFGTEGDIDRAIRELTSEMTELDRNGLLTNRPPAST